MDKGQKSKGNEDFGQHLDTLYGYNEPWCSFFLHVSCICKSEVEGNILDYRKIFRGQRLLVENVVFTVAMLICFRLPIFKL